MPIKNYFTCVPGNRLNVIYRIQIFTIHFNILKYIDYLFSK